MTHILLLTHNNVGPDMLNTAERIIDNNTTSVRCVEVPMESDPEQILELARSFIDGSSDTLLLTDLYGSTPGNIALELSKLDNTRMVSGLNMSMLLRVLNYQSRPMDELADIAVVGGQSGIKAY